jgi:hypothetical protein
MVMRAILLSILLCFFGSQYALAVERQIDPEQSTLTIHVGKSGLLSAAAHEYTVTAPIANGTIDDGVSAEISFRVEAIRLTVLPEEHRSNSTHDAGASSGKQPLPGNLFCFRTRCNPLQRENGMF